MTTGAASGAVAAVAVTATAATAVDAVTAVGGARGAGLPRHLTEGPLQLHQASLRSNHTCSLSFSFSPPLLEHVLTLAV